MLGRRDRGPERRRDHVNFVRPGRRGHTPANEVNNSVCARRLDLLSRLTRAYRLVWYLGPGHCVERLPGTMPWNDVLDADVPEPGDLLGMSESRCSGRTSTRPRHKLCTRLGTLQVTCAILLAPRHRRSATGAFRVLWRTHTLRGRSMRPSYSSSPPERPRKMP
jgi:hypothetical protein